MANLSEYEEILFMEKEVMSRDDLSEDEKIKMIEVKSLNISLKHGITQFGSFEDYHRQRGGEY